MIKDIVTAKHNQLIATANEMCNKLYTLKEDIEDIFDTIQFLKIQKIGVPQDCIHLANQDDNIMELHCDGEFISLDFYSLNSKQHCSFSNGDFNLECIEQTDYRFTSNKIAKFINYNNEYDFYTKQCCILMQGFIEMFPLFKQKFIESINAM